MFSAHFVVKLHELVITSQRAPVRNAVHLTLNGITVIRGTDCSIGVVGVKRGHRTTPLAMNVSNPNNVLGVRGSGNGSDDETLMERAQIEALIHESG